MNPQEFYKRLEEAQNLMLEEKYKESLVILDELKQLEKEEDFEYNLIHKLYQLISNTKSLYNQKIILNRLSILASVENRASIEIPDLNNILKEEDGFSLDLNILKRELEMLILRDLANFQIDGNNLKLQKI